MQIFTFCPLAALQIASKYSNIAARCRSHVGFGDKYIKLNMINQQSGSGF
jgi:hypothetical protein